MHTHGELLKSNARGWSSIVYLFEIEFVAEHPLTVLTHPRLSRLPGGPEQSRHLVRPQQGGHLVSSAGPVHTLRCTKGIFRVSY